MRCDIITVWIFGASSLLLLASWWTGLLNFADRDATRRVSGDWVVYEGSGGDRFMYIISLSLDGRWDMRLERGPPDDHRVAPSGSGQWRVASGVLQIDHDGGSIADRMRDRLAYLRGSQGYRIVKIDDLELLLHDTLGGVNTWRRPFPDEF